MPRAALLVCVAFAAVACSDRTVTGSGGASDPPPTGPVGSTRGSSIVISRDETLAVAANRTTGSVTVFRLDASMEDAVVSAREVDMGLGSQPWASVIGPDDDTAYVLLRGSSERSPTVARLSGLRSRSPRVTGEILVGSEPTAIVITPNGTRLFIANSADGTISFIDLNAGRDFDFGSSPDLNLPLARTGYLGPLDATWSEVDLQRFRPALAHPRALAITDDGDEDDTDETLYVTEFFSQPIPGVDITSDASLVDRSRQGLVYPVDTASMHVIDEPITLSPIDTGFPDAKNQATSCFPNQLNAASVSGNRLFVTAMCASPAGPVGPGPAGSTANFKTLVHPAIFVVDTDRNVEMAQSAVVLTKELDTLFRADSVEAAPEVRMPLMPNDIDVVEDASGRSAYVSAFGADAVYRVDFGSDDELRGIGAPHARYVDLHAAGFQNARLPTGLALSKRSARPFALVPSEFTRNVSTIDLRSQTVTGVRPTYAEGDPHGERIDEAVSNGRRLFATGLGAWSFQGEAWSSCESCHPEGLSDGITWYFARGPRRSISLAGTYTPERAERRMLLWTASIDEIHDLEAIVRGVSGGVGAVLWNDYQSPPSKDCRLVLDGKSPPAGSGDATCPAALRTTNRLNGLNGGLAEITRLVSCTATDATCDSNASTAWNDVDAYVQSVRAPRRPSKVNADFVREGEAIFAGARCGVCHGGPAWTVSRVFYDPSLDNNGAIPSMEPAPSSVDLSKLLGRLRTEPYEVSPLLHNAPTASGSATFRSFAPTETTAQAALDFIYRGADHDHMNCSLRTVRTFPEPPTPPDGALLRGVVPTGAPQVLEMRETLDTNTDAYRVDVALGASGFNVPSLVGIAGSAPYFHAGNARTLEEVFDPTFAAHHQAIDPTFLADDATRPEIIRKLVSYLLTIDEDKPPQAVPDTGFDADPCAQFGN